MSSGISFYTYMWINEDIKNITGKSLNISESQFRNQVLCGVLTNFINTIEPVLIIRARINDAQEFYSDYAGRVKKIVDNLDYDILSKDGAMVDKVKFITNKVDQYNNNYDQSVEQFNAFMNMTDNYILDMYKVFRDIHDNISKDLEVITNQVLEEHMDFKVNIDNKHLESYEEIKSAIFKQLSSQNMWFWDHMNEYIEQNKYDEIVKYHLVLCMYHILVHVSESAMKAGNTEMSDEFRKNFDGIIGDISEAMMPLMNKNNSRYQVVDTSAIISQLKKVETVEDQYKEFVDEAAEFPLKDQSKDNKDLDLDALIKHGSDDQ